MIINSFGGGIRQSTNFSKPHLQSETLFQSSNNFWQPCAHNFAWQLRCTAAVAGEGKISYPTSKEIDLPLVAMAPSNTIRHRAIAAFIFEEWNFKVDNNGILTLFIYHDVSDSGLTIERAATSICQPQNMSSDFKQKNRSLIHMIVM